MLLWGITSHITFRLQKLVNTALINAVNSENPEIVLRFTHLLAGAKYINRDDILEVYINYDTGIQFKNGSQKLPSEIMITYEGIVGLDVIQVCR